MGLQLSISNKSFLGLGIKLIIPCVIVVGSCEYCKLSEYTLKRNGALFQCCATFTKACTVTAINRKSLLPHFPNPAGSLDHSDWTSLSEGGIMYCSPNPIGPLFVMGGSCQAGALSCNIRHFALTAVR